MALKIKSLLTPFFKLAHPDVLRQAPENVQKSNTAALATLNSYIDSVTQGDPVSLSSLRFYVMREKKYTECKVTLLPLRQATNMNQRNLHLESVVYSINQAIASPEEAAFEEPETISPTRFRMKEEELKSSVQQIQNFFAMKVRSDNRENVLRNVGYKIESEYNRDHPSTLGLQSRRLNKFVKAALEASVAGTLFKSLERNHVRLDKLFIADVLNNEQVAEGLNRLSGKGVANEMIPDMKSAIINLNEKDFGIVISNRYSVMNVPGCLQVPFDFKITDFLDFYRGNFDFIYERFMDYCNFASKVNKNLKFISEITLPCTLARYIYKDHKDYEQQSFEQSYISSKRILKLIEASVFPRGLKDCILILGLRYNNEKGFIQVPMDFTDVELINFLTKNIEGQKIN